jgi:hypothetical protein
VLALAFSLLLISSEVFNVNSTQGHEWINNWEHMKGAAIATVGKPATYSEVSGMYMGLVKGGSQDTAQIAKLGDLRQTLFMGNTLRGMLLEAYAFGTMGTIAGYGAIAALIGGLLMLVLTIAGLVHIRRTPEDATI